MNKKTVISFVGGAMVGAYMMYNKMYREISKIALGYDPNEKVKEFTDKNKEA